MSGHTLGPWTIAHGKIVGNGYNIASINSSATSEGKANALIMAAAPDLLEACKAFIAYDDTDDHDGVAMMINYDDALKACRAAIAKATGQ